MRPVLILLSLEGFDPTEAAVPWQALIEQGIPVVFASPQGKIASADPLMVTGEGLDVWSKLPGFDHIKLVGLFLRANQQARDAYAAMQKDPSFLQPIKYENVRASDYSGLLLPGGHAKSIRAYLESSEAQRIARDFMTNVADASERTPEHKPVAAICHGVLVLARATGANGKPLLHGKRVTALTWPLEKKAWQVARISRFWEPNYYRTYPEAAGEPSGYRSTEAEIKRLLAKPEDFISVPTDAEHYRQKTSGLHRDTPQDTRASWVVEDGNLITARWPGDVNAFTQRFVAAIKRHEQQYAQRPY